MLYNSVPKPEHFVKRKVKKYLKKCFPDEGCGLIVRGRFIPCDNVLHEMARKTNFRIASRAMRKYAGKIDAVIHSHIKTPPYPSVFDMQRQIETAVPWGVGVVSENKILDFFWFGGYQPVTFGRPFRHGATDCYSLIRDYYHEKLNIDLPDFARAWEWWKTSDLLSDAFRSAGFRRLSAEEVKKPNDLVCIGVKTPRAHHCAIYLGNDKIIHHPGGARPYDPLCKPRIESVYRYARHIKFWLRYD